jgi:hypothetical protein
MQTNATSQGAAKQNSPPPAVLFSSGQISQLCRTTGVEPNDIQRAAVFASTFAGDFPEHLARSFLGKGLKITAITDAKVRNETVTQAASELAGSWRSDPQVSKLVEQGVRQAKVGKVDQGSEPGPLRAWMERVRDVMDSQTLSARYG